MTTTSAAPDVGLLQGTVTQIVGGAVRVQADGSDTDVPVRAAYGVLFVGDRVALQPIKGNIYICFSMRSSGLMPGQFVIGGWSSLPPFTFLMNGQAVSRTTYAALFNAIGTSYGAGDGVTTFNVPDYYGTLSGITRMIIAQTSGTTGGSATHTHTSGTLADTGHIHALNGTGFAAITLNGTTGVRGLVSGGVSYVANNKQPSATAVAGAGETTATQLLGGTNSGVAVISGSTGAPTNGYPPWLGALHCIAY